MAAKEQNGKVQVPLSVEIKRYSTFPAIILREMNLKWSRLVI